MTWKNRTAPNITLTSPSGAEFVALWADNQRTISKKLGVFELPDKVGAVVQDLEVGAYRHTIPVFFDGSNHDIEAERFMVACAERGEWSVNHPTKGILILQLISVSERIAPVENGNFTQIDTEWIEPKDEQSTLTPSDLSQRIRAGINASNETATEQLLFFEKQDKAIQTAIIEIETITLINIVNNKLSTLYNRDPDVSSQVLSVQYGIRQTISADIIDLEVLAAQIQTMFTLPLQASNDLGRIVDYTSAILNIINSGGPSEATLQQRNLICIKELALVSIITAMAEIAITSDVDIRTQSLSLIGDITVNFNAIVDFLDSGQEVFSTSDIDYTYFSQSSSFSDTLGLITNANQYLLIQAFNLAIEKRFLLKQDEAPIFTTIKEYGGLGDDDSRFDFFISTNGLKGNDILLMKSGREVIVYV